MYVFFCYCNYISLLSSHRHYNHASIVVIIRSSSPLNKELAKGNNSNKSVDTILQTVPINPSKFLEEKRWPPLETNNKQQWRAKRIPAAKINWSDNRNGSQSDHLMHHMHTTPRLIGESHNLRPPNWHLGESRNVSQFPSNTHNSITNSSCYKTEFKSPFRFEVCFTVCRLVYSDIYIYIYIYHYFLILFPYMLILIHLNYYLNSVTVE